VRTNRCAPGPTVRPACPAVRQAAEWTGSPGAWPGGAVRNRSRLMASDKRIHVTLECTECKRRNYITNKSKVNDRERIELKKYCRWDRKHTLHKETR
jgi:large subunit ribosomal protein L33